MMPTVFTTIIFTLALLNGWTQPDLHFPIKASNRFDWHTIETEQNIELLKKCVQQNQTEFEWYFLNEDYSPTLQDLKNSLHLIDLNLDGNLDVIFDGESGGEPYSIKIFIQSIGQFKKVLDEQQGIKEMTFKNGILTKIYISDWGCCAEIIHQNYIFNVDFSDKLTPFKKTYSSQNYEKLVWPLAYNIPVHKFQISKPNSKLRFEPMLDDSTNYEGEPGRLIGNSIGEIKLKSAGYILAKKADQTGNYWWFVALETDESLDSTIYYTKKGTPNSYFLGWVNNCFIEIPQ